MNEIELKGKFGVYHLDKFLGGGQTASVYQATVVASSNPERTGKMVAIKMMLPGLDEGTQRRFWQEETILFQLKSGLVQSPDTQPLIPEVWDSGDSIGGGFLVMTLAQGRPLDEMLREATLWEEMDALHLIHQLGQIFASLHTNLQRSYLDFQPRNIFWDKTTRSICVIDWNLLSRAYQSADGTISQALAAVGRQAYRQDMQTIAHLFYRLLLGQEVAGLSVLELATPAHWQNLTRSMQRLLLDLLQPHSLHIENGENFCTRIAAEVKRRGLSGDALLKQADQIVEMLKGLSEEAVRRGQGIPLRQEADALLELAEDKGLSPTWSRFLQNLHETLAATTRATTYLTSGQTFLRAGDRSLAQQFFADGIRLAASLTEQIQGWRWWQLAAIPSSAQGYARMEALLLAAPTAIPDEALATELFALLEETAGQTGNTILQEMAAQYQIARLTGLEMAHLEGADLTHWIATGEAARDTLDQLPGEIDGIHYRQSAWQVSGAGEEERGREAVQKKLDELRQRSQFLTTLRQQIEAVETAQDALLLFQRHPHFLVEDSLTLEFLGRIPGWLDTQQNLPFLAQLLDEMELQRHSAERRREMAHLRHKVYHLRMAQEWSARLSALADRAYPLLANEAPQNHHHQVGKLLDPEILLTSDTFIAALNQTTAFLKVAHQEVTEAPQMLEAMAEELVQAGERLRCSTPQMDVWLAENFNDKHKRLVNSLQLQNEIASLHEQLRRAKEAHEAKIQKIAKEAAETQAKLDKVQAMYEEKLAEAKTRLASEKEEIRNKHQREIDQLETRRRIVTNEIDTLDKTLQKEKDLKDAQSTTWRRQADEARKESTRRQQELMEIKAQLKEFQTQSTLETGNLERTKAFIKQKNEEYANLTNDIRNLEQQKRSIEAQLKSNKEKLVQQRQNTEIGVSVSKKLSEEARRHKQTIDDFPRSTNIHIKEIFSYTCRIYLIYNRLTQRKEDSDNFPEHERKETDNALKEVEKIYNDCYSRLFN